MEATLVRLVFPVLEGVLHLPTRVGKCPSPPHGSSADARHCSGPEQLQRCPPRALYQRCRRTNVWALPARSLGRSPTRGLVVPGASQNVRPAGMAGSFSGFIPKLSASAELVWMGLKPFAAAGFAVLVGERMAAYKVSKSHHGHGHEHGHGHGHVSKQRSSALSLRSGVRAGDGARPSLWQPSAGSLTAQMVPRPGPPTPLRATRVSLNAHNWLKLFAPDPLPLLGFCLVSQVAAASPVVGSAAAQLER